jgi:hypothetical protein
MASLVIIIGDKSYVGVEPTSLLDSVLPLRATRVSKDDIPVKRGKRSAMLRAVESVLKQDKNVILESADSRRDRMSAIQIAERYRARVTGYWFPVSRTMGPPFGGDRAAVRGYALPPHNDEGFNELYVVHIAGMPGHESAKIVRLDEPGDLA